MAGGFKDFGKDSLDITELAALNDEISDDMISQLEQQLSQKLGVHNGDSETQAPAAPAPVVNENDDSTLFEEAPKEEKTAASESAKATEGAKPAEEPSKAGEVKSEQKKDSGEKASSSTESDTQTSKSEKKEINQSFDDNFIKKYKAKLKNRAQGGGDKVAPSYGGVAPVGDEPVDNNMKSRSSGVPGQEQGDISALSQGNINERAFGKDQKSYNDSLDFLDGNVKYKKYVIYIDPQNVNFIENLTVKERKNLINGILREQDDIAITKKRFKLIQTILSHAIIVVLTVTISIPVVYYAINASLEATINNHRNAQTNWQTLYKEHGKIHR